MPKLGRAERAYILARLERLHTLLDQLDVMRSDLARIRQTQKLMRRELLAVKKAVKQLSITERRQP